MREGSLAKGQLEEAKRKLDRTKTQLQGMTARHVDTLNRLETTKVGKASHELCSPPGSRCPLQAAETRMATASSPPTTSSKDHNNLMTAWPAHCYGSDMPAC